ncbi:DegQ family serine endoprotease [soil metagenome]
MLKQKISVPVALVLAIGLFSTTPQFAEAQSSKKALDSRSFIDASQAVLPSVVNISIEPKHSPDRKDKKNAPVQYDDLQQLFDPQSQNQMMYTVTGSGVVISVKDNKGYIITNNHVVAALNDDMQTRLTFHTLPEGRTDYSQTTEIAGDEVRVLGRDILSDLAVIEFNIPKDFKVKEIEFADSDKVEIGENVLALGNPLDLNHTVTQGIISGKARNLGQGVSLERLLQTDAVIQPGNSGGPLVNLDGKIVGINNAIASRNGFWQGTGFAIPSNDARRVSTQLMEIGHVVRGYLGVNMNDIRFVPGATERYEIKDGDSGVLIDNVVRNSPADVAGMHTNDVVVKIDDQPVRDPDEMMQIISRRDVDSKVTFSLIRLDEAEKPITLTIEAKLAERPDETLLRKMHAKDRSNLIPRLEETPDEQDSDSMFGLELEPYYNANKKQGGLRIGSVDPQSAAAEAGLQQGDIVIMLNDRAVRTPSDMKAAMTTPSKEGQMLRFIRDGISQVVVFKDDSAKTDDSTKSDTPKSDESTTVPLPQDTTVTPDTTTTDK